MSAVYSLRPVCLGGLWQFHNLIYAQDLCCIFICCSCLNSLHADRQSQTLTGFFSNILGFVSFLWSLPKADLNRGVCLLLISKLLREKSVAFPAPPWKSNSRHPVRVNRVEGDKWIWLVPFLWNEWKAKGNQTKALICLNLWALEKALIAGSREKRQPLKYTTWQCPFNLFLGHR